VPGFGDALGCVRESGSAPCVLITQPVICERGMLLAVTSGGRFGPRRTVLWLALIWCTTHSTCILMKQCTRHSTNPSAVLAHPCSRCA
jgi:hypothetical protein